MKVFTCEQFKRLEQKAVDGGISWLRLMENAGSAAAKEIRNLGLVGKSVVVVCGKGNNGGDGYVIARKLFENNVKIRVIITDAPSTASAKEMASKSYELGIRPVDFAGYPEICSKIISDADVIVDAMFGIGFRGEPEGIYRDIIELINYSSALKVSVDIPGGMQCDEGKIGNCFIKPDITVTFTAYKPCLVLYPSSDYSEKTVVVDIGIPEEIVSASDCLLEEISSDTVTRILPDRKETVTKGNCGTISLLVGKRGYSGAAVLSSKAAVLSGVGIANAVVPESVYGILGASLPEAVCTVLDDDANGLEDNNRLILEAFKKSDAGLIGCGLGTSEQVKYTVTQLLKNIDIPVVIDADGLNVLSDCIECIRSYMGSKVITPHPKEAARLLNTTVEEVQADRIKAVKSLCEITGAVSVLKGAYTLISVPNGKTYVCTEGNPAMATAGTGDVLSGIIGAFLAEGLSAENAALLSVKLHADCGDRALKLSSLLSVTPSLMLEILPEILSEYYRKKVRI